jgi:acyl-CoA thioester hydrolase
MFRAQWLGIVVGSPGVSTHDTFRLDLVVNEGDTDALGQASNISFVRWIQDVAMAHSSAVGLDLTAYRRIGGVFVVVRHEIDYVRSALRGDELEARTWISSAMAAKCLRTTELFCKRDRELVAKGVTTWGFIAWASGRPKRITEEVRVAFGPYIENGDVAKERDRATGASRRG